VFLPWSLAAAGAIALPGAGSAQVVLEQKISETAGGFEGTLAPGNSFGTSVASLGDLDGDLVSELAVGAFGDDDGDLDQGAVWILFLDASGTVLSEQKISETAGGFTGVLDAGDLFGRAVCGLGDLDGNGTLDLAVGALGDDDGGLDTGAVWILFLNADGTVGAQQKISASEGGLAGVLEAGDGFGVALAALGDLDGDGNTELAVGARHDDDGGTDQGAVWILTLDSGGSVIAGQKISETSGGFTGTLLASDSFGASLASPGDLDGDGNVDLAVGANADDDGEPHQGAVWMLFLDSDGSVLDQQKISATSGGFGGDLDPVDHFGDSLAFIGDMDGNGVTDLAVGASQDDDGDMAQGAVWLLFLEADGTVASERKISATSGGFGGDLDATDFFGFSSASPGDLDGDGFQELAVGARLDDDGGPNQGAVWMLFLRHTTSPPPRFKFLGARPLPALVRPAPDFLPARGGLGLSRRARLD
jgi:hypothetical protein